MTPEEAAERCREAIEAARDIMTGLVESRSDIHHFQTMLAEVGQAGKVSAAIDRAAYAGHKIQLAHDSMQNAIRELEDVIGFINSI